MKFLSALSTIVALAAPAAASTVTHSFDIRVTPTALVLPSMSYREFSFPAGDPRLQMFTPGGCFTKEDDAEVRCSFGSLPLNDLERLVSEYDSQGGGLSLAPVTGRISFDGTGSVACTGGLAPLILACGKTGQTGPGPASKTLVQWNMVSDADATSFEIDSNDGRSVMERVSSGGAYRDADWYETFVIGGLRFESGSGGYQLTSRIELLLDVTQPGTLPSPVPLPASLPLLAGALAVAGAFGRRRRVSRR